MEVKLCKVSEETSEKYGGILREFLYQVRGTPFLPDGVVIIFL